MTRRDPVEMARERVAVAHRIVERAVERVERATAELAAAKQAKKVADTALQYAEQHPLLQQPELPLADG